jgi:hypothetical protein
MQQKAEIKLFFRFFYNEESQVKNWSFDRPFETGKAIETETML